jgi:hypothetical protein
LKDNLIRSTLPVAEQNIAFETDLLYIDIINSRIGVKTTSPQFPLDVVGTIRTTNLEVPGVSTINNLTLTASSITTSAPILSLASPDKILYNNAIIVDDFEISGNAIEITTSNENLELRPNGTGRVEVYSDMDVTGNIHATGSITADGNITIGDQDTDSLTINADIASNMVPDLTDTYNLGSAAKRWNEFFTQDLIVDNISIGGALSGGAITVSGAVNLDGNVTIGTSSANTVNFVAEIASDIIPQTTNLYDLGSAAKLWNTVYSSTINVDGNIRIENNLITTQTTNSNLQLSGSGTGSVEIENFRINDNTITNTVGDMTFTPATGVTVFTGTGSVRLPAGNTASRPAAPQVGMIRYNTDDNLFEGYDGQWQSLQGVYDLDRNTYITAELTPGANDNTIRFYSNSSLVADVNSSRFDVNTLQVDSITISGNTLTTTGTNQDLILNANGTGIIRIENLNFQTNTITNYVSNAPIVFETTGDGYVDVSQAGGVRIPVGDNASRPAVPVIGITRYSTQGLQVEIYDGASWVSVAGSGGGVTVTGAEDIAVKYALTLG